MSSFSDRPKSALLVIDVQNGVVGECVRRDEVVANIASLVAKARQAAVPVIWVQHSDPWLKKDTDDWQIVPELVPNESELIVHKLYSSSFEATDLDSLLDDVAAGHLYICGAQTNFCIRHTSHAALERGYDICLVSDAHTTSDAEWHGVQVSAAGIIAEQNMGLSNYELPGRKAVTKRTEEVVF